MRIILCLYALLLIFGSGYAFGFEPIPITVSGIMDKAVFDGKWTHESEWKASSLNTYEYENDVQIVLRSAHQDDFVYIFLDPIMDYSQDDLGDYAIVCFDTQNNKSAKPDLDDHCFMAYLNDKHGLTYQGGHDSEKNGLSKVVNHEGFIGISTISDANDRYTPIPHPSYEFRIPTDLIGRSHVYGFYFEVYDKNTDKLYTYPENNSTIQSPASWGEIYSPDKSLPEFDLPMIMLLSLLGLVILLTKKIQLKN